MDQETQNGSHFEMRNMRTSEQANAAACKDRKRGNGRPNGCKDKNPRRKAGSGRSKDWAEQSKALKDVAKHNPPSSSSSFSTSSKGLKDDKTLQKTVHQVQPTSTSSVARATRDAVAPVKAPGGGGRGGGGGDGFLCQCPLHLEPCPCCCLFPLVHARMPRARRSRGRMSSAQRDEKERVRARARERERE